MKKKRIAVLLTVYNRKNVTLQGLCSLNRSMESIGNDCFFDIYMTDDGCSDGTRESVEKKFPKVKIVNGDGGLYWGGGMRRAWTAAIDSGVEYDFFLWFNDDDELYAGALKTMFEAYDFVGKNAVVSGAFCDHSGNISYGGRDAKEELIEPNGFCQEVKMMNGNLVLIPMSVYRIVGNINVHFKHGFGDYDYGLRCQKKGIKVFLTPTYVGVVDRHDNVNIPCFDKNKTFIQRWRLLHGPISNPIVAFRFNIKYRGLKKAMIGLVRKYFYVLFPNSYHNFDFEK